MKTLVVSLALLVAANVSFAQTLGLKVYQNTDRYNVTVYNYETESTRDEEVLNFNRISMAFTWKGKSKWFQEVEVFIPEISKPFEDVNFPFEHEFREGYGLTSDVDAYSLRYEVSRSLLNLGNRFDFKLGMGINPYFVRTDYTPAISYMYSLYTTVTGASVNLTPRINFKITDRILLDLNFPFKVYDLSESMKRINNPSIPNEQQKSSHTSNTFFDSVYTVRFGVEFLIKQ